MLFLMLLQALVLSHERASGEEIEPYASVRLAPLQPLVLYGRSAAMAPECDKDQCVWYAWRDCP